MNDRELLTCESCKQQYEVENSDATAPASYCSTECEENSYGAELYHKLAAHEGHKIACVSYADGENRAIECEDCSEVIIDVDRP